jgi:L-Ala-D/L-Glu epimerase
MTRVALSVAQAAGDRLIAQEGAFGTYLLQQDVCTPPLMFGAGGTLVYQSGEPGWGLDCAPDPGCLGD